MAFEWDLRDIDGATHFQGMAMKFSKCFSNICLSKYVENEISIHQFCPQSVLKPSAVHF